MEAATVVFAPVEGFTGTVAGVAFDGGRAEVDPANGTALAYFRRHGYEVGGRTVELDEPEPADPRFLGDGVVGTRLRDAAVDPEPKDFLPPTNAGEANPHGPLVVSPGLHAVPPAPIVPGPVADDTDRQQLVETKVAEVALVDQADIGELTHAATVGNEAKDANPLTSATHQGVPRTGEEADQDDHDAAVGLSSAEEVGTALDEQLAKVTDDTEPVEDVQPLDRPAKSAPVGDWRVYAVSQGMPEDEADATTKTALVERYAG